MKPLIELLLITLLVGNLPGEAKTAPISARTLDQISVAQNLVAQTAIPRRERPSLPVAEDRLAWPKLADSRSLGVEVSAASAIVVDRDNGKVLFEKDADTIRPIASLTKLMTALVAFDAKMDLNKKIVIVAADQKPAEGNILKIGDSLTIRDLFLAALVVSGNDAARALARATGLPAEEFASRMNIKARELGMKHSHFVEPTGLDARNVSTARDLTRLLSTLQENEIIREAAQTKNYRLPSVKKWLPNTDLLISSFLNASPFRIALSKTGTTTEAGYNLAMLVEKGNNGVIAIALASNNHFARFDDVKALAYWAFTKWSWKDDLVFHQ